MLPVALKVPAAGSYSCAVVREYPLLPPAMRTFPPGNSVAVWPKLMPVMLPVSVNGEGVTVSEVEPMIVFSVAEMVVEPIAAPDARPAALPAATFVADEVHATELVRFRVLVSVYEPVAVNCWALPEVIEGLAGVTAIDTKDGAVTVRVVDPVTVPETA